MAEREIARIDDFEIEIEDIRDTIEKSICAHESAYRDGAWLEDLGAGPREISFRCFFYGERYRDHFAFYDHVCKTTDDLFELEHPTYGITFVKINRVSINRDDSPDTISVDITCTEELLGPFNMIPPPLNIVDAQAEDNFNQGIVQQIDQSTNDLIDAIGDEAQKIIGRTIDPAQSLINQFTDVTLSARDVLNKIDSAIFLAESLCSSITVPANELVSMAEYPSTVPGRISQAAINVAARYAESVQGLAQSPEHYICNLASALDGLVNKFDDDYFPFKTHVLISSGLVLALQTAYRYDEDEANRSVIRTLESSPAFGIDGKYLHPPEPPQIMNVNQLEKTLAIVRTFLQYGIDAARSMTSLKDIAKTLLDHVYQIKLETEKIIKKTYKSESPLHLICCREGLSYAYAERVHSINPGMKNPSFVFGEINIYA